MLTSEEVQGIDPEVDIIIDNEDKDKFFFVMKSGPYKGIAYGYADVQIHPNEEAPKGGPSHFVEFNYAILENPTEFAPDEGFQDKIGDLLVKMIDRLVEKLPTA